MRLIGAAILCVGSAAMMFAQRPGGSTSQPYGSLGGYGNVLYPGTGHAPNVNQSFPARLGATVAGHPYGPGYYSYPVNAPRQAHPAGHSRTAVVPYPVYLGGGYYGAYTGGGYAPDAYQAPPQQEQPTMDAYGMPSVVINQNFVPDRANPVIRNYGDDQPPPESSGMKLYQTPPTRSFGDAPPPPAARRQPGPDPQPTIYLLAFKDHNIVPALGYWMEGATLHYVSVEHSLNQASFDLIDRDLSQRLNDERGVEFKLPAQQ
jgi:hypothetical protein